MKNFLEPLIFAHVVVVAAITLFFLIFAWTMPMPVRHNICTIAEISPDITPEERKRCREIRGHKL